MRPVFRVALIAAVALLAACADAATGPRQPSAPRGTNEAGALADSTGSLKDSSRFNPQQGSSI